MTTMTGKQQAFLATFKGKNAAVLGIGRSNVPVIKFLVQAGAKVAACDAKPEKDLGAEYREVSSLPVDFRFGPGYLEGLEKFDMIFPTPGMPLDLPELVKAREHGAWQSNEVGLFLALCEAPVVGITGSDGKTTTTTLVSEVLKAAGRKVFTGGNIGNPLLSEVFDITPDSLVVLELSSFQLQPLDASPHIGAILNLSANHLDHHRSMEEYAEAKANIFRHQGSGDFVVLNFDNPWTRTMGDECPGGRVFFTRTREMPGGVFVRGNDIVSDLRGQAEVACSRGDIRIPGEHNVENVLAVTAIAALCDVDFATLREVLRAFTGVAHRIEFVAEVGGVRFYDDSIATTPSRAVAGIRSFTEPVVVIAGGSDKNVPFDEFAEVAVNRAKAVVLVGETAPKIQAAIEEAQARQAKTLRVVVAQDFEEAVRLAVREAAPGDVVLLSPACASFDMFRDYKERGDKFKAIVRAMRGKNATVGGVLQDGCNYH
ncbi:MAG: UDP-N-acetylmuramoyl-L-alanine--D-glutamate ligase [Bacillota bacterium]